MPHNGLVFKVADNDPSKGKSKKQTRPREYRYPGGKTIWARNDKNADRKARNKGYLPND